MTKVTTHGRLGTDRGLRSKGDARSWSRTIAFLPGSGLDKLDYDSGLDWPFLALSVSAPHRNIPESVEG